MLTWYFFIIIISFLIDFRVLVDRLEVESRAGFIRLFRFRGRLYFLGSYFVFF